MPFAELKHATLYYELDGPPEAPVLLLSNPLGTDLSLWDAQMPVFTRSFRVLRYDTRGHGQSSVGAQPTAIPGLAEDAAALLDLIGAQRASFCGLSLGGMTGMALALDRPDRLHKVVLCNTAARIGTPEFWNTRISAVLHGGMESIADAVIERWFTPDFKLSHSDIVHRIRVRLRNASAEGYASCCAALRDADLRESIAGIRLPTLIVAGTHDPATTTQDAHFMAGKITGSSYAELPTAHLSNVERPEEFSEVVTAFLERNG